MNAGREVRMRAVADLCVAGPEPVARDALGPRYALGQGQ